MYSKRYSTTPGVGVAVGGVGVFKMLTFLRLLKFLCDRPRAVRRTILYADRSGKKYLIYFTGPSFDPALLLYRLCERPGSGR